MSTPTPGALTTGPRVSILRRKLRPNETFEDVMDFAPQVSRPFLMATVKESDDRCVQLNNGLLVTWNGVIVDPTQNPTDPYEWYISEPYRRLDSTIVYADGWERKNNGSFVAQSGLTIDKELTLVHRNGHTVFQDGTTVAPSGKMFQGQANSVGIIYRPGVSNILGIQHLPMQEQEMDDEFRYAIMPVKFDGAIIVPQPSVAPWENVSRIRANANGPVYCQREQYPVSFSSLLPRGGPVAADGKFIPLHMRFAIANENLPQQSAPKEKKMALSLNELHAAIPAELAHLIEGCDVDGCEVDLFGIPLCVPCRERGKLVPYAKKALNKINSGSS